MPSKPQVQTTDEIFQTVKDILEDVAEDWDVDDITPDTRLVDLGMESISLVYLVAELQQHYELGDKLFAKMRAEGTLLKDMSVNDVLTSIHTLSQTA